MTDEPTTPPSDQPATPAGTQGSPQEPSREQKLAEIRARAEALRAARAGGGTATAAPTRTQETSTPAAADPGAAAAPGTSAGTEGSAAGAAGEEPSRDDKMAAIRVRAEALRAARAGGTAAPAAAAGTPAKAAPTRPAAPVGGIDVPVSAVNPGGRPVAAPQSPVLEAYGTLNSSVEIRGEPGENENLKKLLGGLGAYQNPLRSDAWQVDYRYYAEARRRLEAAGYTMTEKDFLDRSIKTWNPASRGWTRVQS